MITLIFTRKNTVWSWVTRVITWTPYSECHLVLDQLTIGVSQGKGVHYEPLDVLIKSASDHLYFEIKGVEIDSDDRTFINAQLTKPYNLKADLGWPIKLPPNDLPTWGGAEWVHAVLWAKGLRLFTGSKKSITIKDLLNSKMIIAR